MTDNGITGTSADSVLPPTTPARPRTQAERSSAMRAKLLDATIECLDEFGYVGMSTARIAEKAGVTRGAQIHHFGSKADLVAAAVEHLVARRAQDALAQVRHFDMSKDLIGQMLDLLWDLHKGPVFVATVELWVAARTDPELAPLLDDLGPAMMESVIGAFSVRDPNGSGAQWRVLRNIVYLAMDAIRGIVLATFADRDHLKRDRLWARARGQLRAFAQIELANAAMAADVSALFKSIRPPGTTSSL